MLGIDGVHTVRDFVAAATHLHISNRWRALKVGEAEAGCCLCRVGRN
jgi:hypothetical protein